MEIETFRTEAGWVVAAGGQWVDGIYDSEQTARSAVDLPEHVLRNLRPIWHIDSENRPATAADIEMCTDPNAFVQRLADKVRGPLP